MFRLNDLRPPVSSRIDANIEQPLPFGSFRRVFLFYVYCKLHFRVLLICSVSRLAKLNSYPFFKWLPRWKILQMGDYQSGSVLWVFCEGEWRRGTLHLYLSVDLQQRPLLSFSPFPSRVQLNLVDFWGIAFPGVDAGSRSSVSKLVWRLAVSLAVSRCCSLQQALPLGEEFQCSAALPLHFLHLGLTGLAVTAPESCTEVEFFTELSQELLSLESWFKR